MDIKSEVKNNLSESTAKMSKSVIELDEINDKIGSGNFSVEYINDYLKPKADEIKQSIASQKETATANANKLIDDYCDTLRKSDELDSSKLNDDIKLLSCGIALNEKDILAMLRRNEDNKTMLQLIMRYAKANDIEVKYHIETGEAQARQVELLKSTVKYYMNHIDKANALNTLDKFFE